MRICPHIVFVHMKKCESFEQSSINPQITPILNHVKINPVDTMNKFYSQSYPDSYSVYFIGNMCLNDVIQKLG